MDKNILLLVGLLISVLLNAFLIWLEIRKDGTPKGDKPDLSKKEIAMVKQIVNIMNFDGMDDVNED